MAGANPNPPLQMPYLASLNIPDLTKLTNDPILHNPTWPAMPTKLPSDIPKFEGKAGDDPANHVMTFHLWCSSNSIMEDSVRLRLFQRTLTGPSAKWYVEEKSGSHATFESLAKAFLTFFQLPIRHDNGLELLSNFKQTSATHIADHIHEWRRRRSLCKAETTKQQCLDWFLRSLVSLLGKDVASTFPQTEEEAISKAQQYDLIYAQSGYLYTVLPDLPKPTPFGQDKPGMSHSADGLIGATTHHGPQPQQPPMYGTPQYPPVYGGTPYYPPPTYQQPYPVATPPPTSGPPPAPPVHPPISTNSGTPSTSSYSTSESTQPPYVPYGSVPPQNPYFPFPGPPRPMAPPHPNAGVNFVQPSAAQQYQNFEQLNTANPPHPANNNRRKGKNRNNNNPGQGGNRPPQHQPPGGIYQYHRCIIDEGASTCIMSKTVWQKLGSPELTPSAITLRAYDGRPSSPEGLLQNVPVELGGKTILIDIEVIDVTLDYNILFGRSYMYAMKAVASSVFRTIMFPHNGKIVTLDQLSYYEPNPSANVDNILPLIHTNQDVYPLVEMGPGIFKDPSLLGTYHGAPPLLPPNQVCVVTSNQSHIEDTRPPQETPVIPDVSAVAASLPPEPPANSSTPTVHESTPPQGPNPIWETVPRPLTQIPFFYPPPGVQAFQVAATLTLPNMVLAIPVWYLHPPEMVPRPQEGFPMAIPVLTPTPPTTPILPTPILPTPPATAGGRRKQKEPVAPRPPRIPPPCALCEKAGHQTNNCPSLPELRNLIPPNPTPTPLTTTATTQPSSSKGLKTKFACAICSEYGHYTHHCPALPRFRQALAIVKRDIQNNPCPAASSSNITDIRYVTTSVNERMRCPCSLCDSLTHFTYQCPMIIEYRQRQWARRHHPTEVIHLPASPADPHVISLQTEALPTPPWFLDDISEDLPRNPPNSPAHSSTATRHPTTTGTTQSLNIWFMSSESSPSPSITPFVSSIRGKHTGTEITHHDPLYSRCFQNDEEILEELNSPDFPWDALHHRALFLPQETLMPPNQNPMYTVETKDFIPPGPSIGSKTPFPLLMRSKKATWLTFPPPSRSTFL
jgi:hypothetical protein